MTDTQRDAQIMKMAADVSEIKAKVTADYRALYGNGHPGLLHEHEDLKNAVIKLIAEQSPSNAQLAEKIGELEKEHVAVKSSRATMYAIGSGIIAVISAIASIVGLLHGK